MLDITDNSNIEQSFLNCCVYKVQCEIFKEMFGREPDYFELQEIKKSEAKIFYDSRNKVNNA